jgi:hypothetical protein
MSSGTTAEPIQPEAPVTKMRMEILLGQASSDEGARRTRRGRNTDAIRSHQLYHNHATKSHHLQLMRSGRLA